MKLYLLLAICACAVACVDVSADDRLAREVTGGNPDHGREQIHNYGCDSCHTIPGIKTATATVGPPLIAIARRTYLAGRIENTPENMMQWIRFPRSIDDQTAMPETGVTDRDSRDSVAYLYTLH